MKSHELADALLTLSRVLKSGPNVELSSLSEYVSVRNSPRQSTKPKRGTSDDRPAGLIVLVELASYNKAQWRSLINELDLDVEVKNTDSVRDLIGRLLNHIKDNPQARHQVLNLAEDASSSTSPELLKALSILMQDAS